MKKIGLITICDYNNYGNRLQNYAAQEVLQSLNFYVETIRNENPTNISYINNNIHTRFKRIINMSRKDLFRTVKMKLIHITFKDKNIQLIEKRIIGFKKFTNEYIKETEFVIKQDDIPQYLEKSYDFFVVGSDQIWNPIFRKGSSIDFLTFAPKHKRIAYAPSFGIESIPDEYIDEYKYWLTDMEYLSVREDAGAKIIKKLTGRDAPVLVDPTLMLSKEKWLSISKESINKPKDKYLLTYFLGEISPVDKKIIRKIALKNKLKIVNLSSTKDEKYYTADPSEFIDYINSSSIFFTDSFHGAVFSILLEKSFVILDRIEKVPSMNSRLDTLLSTFKFESRKWNNIKDNENIFDIDFSHIPSILYSERNKALNYLKNAFNYIS